MWKRVSLLFCLAAGCLGSQASSFAQDLEIKRYNPTPWTKGFYSEIVTVNGPGKTLYMGGITAADEDSPPGTLPKIRHLGSAYEQCRYIYDKMKRVIAPHGATLADVVKQVVYVTDIRFQADVGKCRAEAYGAGPIPANSFIVVSGLAVSGVLVEIDITAVVPK